MAETTQQRTRVDIVRTIQDNSAYRVSTRGNVYLGKSTKTKVGELRGRELTAICNTQDPTETLRAYHFRDFCQRELSIPCGITQKGKLRPAIRNIRAYGNTFSQLADELDPRHK